MARIWGFDIGTTSIGWTVIEQDVERAAGSIAGMGVRIFPEARDPDGTPLNQTRRQKRMMRRQLRRRRERRKALNMALADAGLLPAFHSDEWAHAMAADPWALRARGLSERLTPEEFGRALYHLAKRRHFRGRDLEESDAPEAEDADEKAAKSARDLTIAALKATGQTLGQTLAERGPHERKRGVHALREHVQDEFERLWAAQAEHHPALNDMLKAHVDGIMFAQKPVFWRKSTLGTCPLMPGEELCPKGSWLSQQRRMLEKLNNLEIASGNRRPLDPEERAALLEKLQTQGSMSWAGVRKALAPLYAARGEKGMEARIRFNLELGGEAKLLGNPLEAKLADIFGDAWSAHPHKQAIRDAVQQRLWAADYGEVGSQRVVIRRKAERDALRATAAQRFVEEFGTSAEQADALRQLKLPSGWEPFSTKALDAILPQLESGARFGALMISQDFAEWRAATFPDRQQPTGELLDRLPSPSHRRVAGRENHAGKEEQRRLATLRNPTVARTQNELRKVVNNLLGAYGKPDLIRIELARDVGLSKREREEKQAGIRKNEKRRAEARKDLEAKGILQPSRGDIEKWVLWKEGQERCPYTGDQIGFDALFRTGEFDVEHIWPRGRSLDDSQRNKTLCRKDVNLAKGNCTPFEFYRGRPDEWEAIKARLDAMVASKGGPGFPRGKVKRFLAEAMPDDFAARQLVDTGYAARQAVALLKRLWPDVGEPNQAVDFGVAEDLRRRTVQSVNGRVTAQLRKLWGLNNILSDVGEKTRADHRHHAIDALAVACAHPGMTQLLSRYWQQRDDPAATKPDLPAPWPTIRADAAQAVEAIVVSHRVRKKVSGPLHKETTYGDTGEDVTTSNGTYRLFVTTKPVGTLSFGELADIRDHVVRDRVTDWIEDHGGDPKKAFADYPVVGEVGPKIRKVRLTVPMKLRAVAPSTTGYAATGNNHHIAIYSMPGGKIEAEVVSLYEASRRVARRTPVVRKTTPSGGRLFMSLSLGDTFYIPMGERAGYWAVKTISANGQIFCKPIADADTSSAGLWGPSPSPLAKLNPRKVSVDPIGRVRPAND